MISLLLYLYVIYYFLRIDSYQDIRMDAVLDYDSSIIGSNFI